MRILILEDCAERRTAMIEHLADSLPMFGVRFFETAPAMIREIEQSGLKDVALISLNNDPEPSEFVDGVSVDAGSGIDVAQFLATHCFTTGEVAPGAIPIIVHSTNEPASATITSVLRESGNEISRIVPYDGERWIGEIWVRRARSLIVGNVTESRHLTR